jgi:hypothetical protein
VANTEIPPLGKVVPQVGPPAGAVADEYGTKTLWLVPLTATEWALLPEGSLVTSVLEAASMMLRTGLQGFAAVQVPPAEIVFPVSFQRLEAA